MTIRKSKLIQYKNIQNRVPKNKSKEINLGSLEILFRQFLSLARKGKESNISVKKPSQKTP